MKKLIALLITTLCFSFLSFAEETTEKIIDPIITKTVHNGQDWVKERDAQKDDIVKFRLVGTLPSNWEDLTEYPYVFVDDFPKGEKYQNDAKVAYHSENKETDITKHTTITYENDKLRIEFKDLKSVLSEASGTVVVYYSAKISAQEGDLVNYAQIMYRQADLQESKLFRFSAVYAAEADDSGLTSSVTDKATVHVKNTPAPDPEPEPTTEPEPEPTPKDPPVKPSIAERIAKAIKTGDARMYAVFGLMAFAAGFTAASFYFNKRLRKDKQ